MRKPGRWTCLAAVFLLLPAVGLHAQRNLRKAPKPDPVAELGQFQAAEGFEVNLFAANPLISKGSFCSRFDIAVIAHDQVRTLANQDTSCSVNAKVVEFLNLQKQRQRIYDDAVSDDAGHVRMQDA